jgi:HEXXH motif-containing protein
MLRRHRLPWDHFHSLAEGRATPEVINGLRRGERSRRLLLFKVLLDAGARDPGLVGPLPPARDAWAAVVRADAVSRAEVDRLLLAPHVGSALAYAVRRLRIDGSSTGELWADVGFLHTFALLAAAATGGRWETTLPTRDGALMLPGLGMALLNEPTVPARTDAGRIWLDGREVDPPTGSPQWMPSRYLDAGGWTVCLEELDPHRDLADPEPPQRLTDEAARDWAMKLTEAWRLLSRDDAETAAAIAAAISSVVPLPATGDQETRSASTGDAFGAILVSPPPDGTSLAVALVHEYRHTALGGLIHLLRLTTPDGPPDQYAPWRDDPRPIGGLLQGAYAFHGIADWWRRHRHGLSGRDRDLADFEFVYNRDSTAEALRTLKYHKGLTDHGRAIVDGLQRTLDAWPDEKVGQASEDLAHLARDAHRAGWRIRNRRPRPDAVAEAVRVWPDGRPDPGTSTVESDGTQGWSLGRLGLIRRYLAAPDRAAELLGRDGLDQADWDLVRGDTAAAARGYLARIAADAGDLDAWTGLGLAVRGRSRTLVDHPDWVRTVHSVLKVPPSEVVPWLGGT